MVDLQAVALDLVAEVGALSATDLSSRARTRWPMADRPFADVVAWVNVELMKNAAEIGFARFLYATRRSAPPTAPVS